MTYMVVGGGKMGMSHLALLSKYVGRQNVALCETSFITRALFRLLGFKTFSSPNQALRKLDCIDALIIATPTSSHVEIINWAIDHKISFFVEKPLTLNADLSYELLKRSELSLGSSQVGFVMRYVASFQALRKLVQLGTIGKVRGYSASMTGNVISKSLSHDNWKVNFCKGGGCLNEYGPHIIDLCKFIFGPVVEIRSSYYRNIHSSLADDETCISWMHISNLTGDIKINWSDASKRKSVIEFFVEFDCADVRVDNSTLEIIWKENAPISIESRSEIACLIEPVCVDFYLRGEEFSLQLQDFMRLISENLDGLDFQRLNQIGATLKDGYEVDLLIGQIAKKAGLM